MKNRLGDRTWLRLVALLAMGCLLGAGSFLSAADEDETELEDIAGSVQVKKVDGKVTEVRLLVQEFDDQDQEVTVAYKVVLDAKGKELGEKMEGKQVEVRGVVVDKGNDDKPDYWIQVKSFRSLDDEN